MRLVTIPPIWIFHGQSNILYQYSTEICFASAKEQYGVRCLSKICALFPCNFSVQAANKSTATLDLGNA